MWSQADHRTTDCFRRGGITVEVGVHLNECEYKCRCPALGVAGAPGHVVAEVWMRSMQNRASESFAGGATTGVPDCCVSENMVSVEEEKLVDQAIAYADEMQRDDVAISLEEFRAAVDGLVTLSAEEKDTVARMLVEVCGCVTMSVEMEQGELMELEGAQLRQQVLDRWLLKEAAIKWQQGSLAQDLGFWEVGSTLRPAVQHGLNLKVAAQLWSQAEWRLGVVVSEKEFLQDCLLCAA